MKPTMAFIKFREEMDILFIMPMADHKIKIPTKIWIKNPFTGMGTTAYYKSMTKDGRGIIYVEGNDSGSVYAG